MKPAATKIAVPALDSGVAPTTVTAIGPQTTSVVTRMNFAAPPERVWSGLMFYEQIEEPPPLHLRLLLPLPIRTSGSKSEVGDEATCLYAGGYLLKRVTQIEPWRLYGFAVVEQKLTVGGGLILTGGCYTLRELPLQRTEVAVTTRYLSNKRPAWLWKPIEATVCHLFHRHLLSAMRRKIESR